MAREHVLLPVHRQVLRELAHHHVGQEAGPCQPPRDRIVDRGCPGHAVLAARAGVLGVDVSLHDDLGRHHLNSLGDVLADADLLPAAGAGAFSGSDVVAELGAGQMRRNGISTVAAPALLPGRFRRSRLRLGDRLDRHRRCVIVKEMPLARCLDEPLAPRPEIEALQRQVLLVQAVVGPLKLAAGDTGFLELPLEVGELDLQLAKLLEEPVE